MESVVYGRVAEENVVVIFGDNAHDGYPPPAPCQVSAIFLHASIQLHLYACTTMTCFTLRGPVTARKRAWLEKVK